MSAAVAAGVDRSTVYRWMGSDPVFAAELNRARRDQAEAIRGELRDLAAEAVRTLRHLVTSQYVPPAVRLRAAVPPARQPAHPARGEQVEGVPPLGAPTLADPAAVEHHVVVAGGAEQPAHRQARVTGADHDRVDGAHDDEVTTSMTTGVGLVRAS